MLTDKLVAVERLIAAALSFVGFKEVNSNRGQVVERFLQETGLPGGYAWCAAFIYHVGYWSQYDECTGKSTWPLPATPRCLDLYKAAMVKAGLFEKPERGDLFLLYVPSEKRLAHTGVILSVKALPDGTYQCQTVEGNTNRDGSREGDSVLIKTRVFNPKNGTSSDCFIRWVDMPGAAR